MMSTRLLMLLEAGKSISHAMRDGAVSLIFMCLSILRFIHKVSNIFTIISHRDSHFASQWAAGTQQAKKRSPSQWR